MTTPTDLEIVQQKEFRRLHQQISALKKKAAIAHDLRIAAETRAHDFKLRAKTAEIGLRGLLQRCMRAEAWIEAEGNRTDTCTFDILKKVCSTCRCGRLMEGKR